jgi:hypothetical protein
MKVPFHLHHKMHQPKTIVKNNREIIIIGIVRNPRKKGTVTTLPGWLAAGNGERKSI